MIYSPNNFFQKDKTYDICIIGAGIMGIVLANELKNTSLKICVIESADGENDPVINEAKKVESSGLPIKNSSRERALGGSSTTWWALSGLFDQLDFKQQRSIPFSGWPIDHGEVIQYCEIASKKYNFPEFSIYKSDKLNLLPVFSNVDSIAPKVFAAKCRPQRFWKCYRHIFKSSNLDLIKGLTVKSLDTKSESESLVKKIVGLTLEKKEYEIYAKKFILAAGGIENPRILLNSKIRSNMALGNEYDQVGRYFMNHPKGYCGEVEFSDSRLFEGHFMNEKKGVRYYTGISLSKKNRKKKGLLNCYIEIIPRNSWSGDIAFSVYSGFKEEFKNLIDSIRKKEKNFLVFFKRIFLVKLFYVFFTLFKSLHKLLLFSFCQKVGYHPKVKTGYVRNYLDMAPHPENRVTLSKNVDLYGIPKATLRATLGEKEKESLIELHNEVSKIFILKNYGKFYSKLSEVVPWPITEDASHHMGTTRMGNDPKNSVVDSNSKLHNSPNVYIAGTSTFPTGSSVNPTLTAVALAIRLAEHLKTV